MRTRWKEIFLSLLAVVVNSSQAATMTCEEFQNEFRYPCACEEFRPIGGLAINCDGVVFSGDNFVMPKDAPILVFTQKNAGHHSVPTQLFPSSGK